jgi:methyl-accepting chemotaxis protein
MKNIKIGVKLIGGFIIVALIVLVVGFFGWNGARQLQDHIHEIGDVRLPSVESLLRVQVEGNTIRTAVRTMLNPRLSMGDKQRQYDNIEGARERYRAAWDVYEPLPQTAKEAEVWGEFVTAWNAWAEVNNRVVEMAREIDGTDILNPDALRARLLGFITDHHILMENVLKLILNGEMFEGGGDPAACNFGIWLADYSTTNETVTRLLQEVRTYHDPFHESVNRIKASIQAGNQNEAFAIFSETMQPNAEEVFDIFNRIEDESERVVALYDSMNEYAFGEVQEKQNAAIGFLTEVIDINDVLAEEAVHIADGDGARVEMIALIGMVAGVIVGIILGIILTRGITAPLAKGVYFAREIADGNLQIELDVEQKDEVGQLAESLKFMLGALQYKEEAVQTISEKDLTLEVKPASEKDSLGQSLVSMVDSLNEMLAQVNEAVDQVASGSDQVSQASQNLSQGATEQASSLEQISSSITEVNSQSKQNADNATEANGLAKQATDDAESGNVQMKELVEAMGRINASSDEISKVVKVIDDIAFQINLLALNANVEAARAGKYGKGFAVVAEEVRNLAVRAAEAVKETTAMVEDSISNINTGNELVEKTAGQLEAIVTGSTKVAEFLGEIASASKEQAQAIDQITEGLDQIDQVTQGNTASAEESASAAEELAGQAQQLKAMIATFKLKNSGDEGERLALEDTREEG